MSKLKVGDRVKMVLPKFDEEALLGETGKVIAFEYDLIGVEFDNNILGHDCLGSWQRWSLLVGL